ncbi:hypothetical protein [Victivallis vadensis]|uniref:hypothetical protein n=1 Tax=Victivallis vadensis TaxID=172901 RepID=UPI003D0038C3
MKQAHNGFGISPSATKALRPWNPTGKVPAPNTLDPGKPERFSLRVGETLLWTGRRVPERHTAPVGDRVGFFADAGHSLRLLPPEVTRGTSRC